MAASNSFYESEENDAEFVGDEATSDSELDNVNVASGSQDLTNPKELNLAYRELEAIPEYYQNPSGNNFHPRSLLTLNAHHNSLTAIPSTISLFAKLVQLDFSNNRLTAIPDAIGKLEKLRALNLSSNQIDSNAFPKTFDKLCHLENLNMSGNQLSEIPESVLGLTRLRRLHLGGNAILTLSQGIRNLISLEHLYLGGNKLRSIPNSIGNLWQLQSLALCDNKLTTIPSSVAYLQSLTSLQLHNNCIKTLPPEIVKLTNLSQLSIRNNPLIYQFVKNVSMKPPSLLELASRVVKINRLDYRGVVPYTVEEYLSNSHQCVNPKCKGVYFDARVEHVKFVDFCGKYRVPLLQYLCSPVCDQSPAYAITTATSEEDDLLDSDSDDWAAGNGPESAQSEAEAAKMKKILLG